MPMSRRFGGTSVTSLPSITTRPEVGRSKPATSRSAVVLPQPDGPSSETNSPVAISRSMPARATTSPNRRCNCFSSTAAMAYFPPSVIGAWRPLPTASSASIAAQVIANDSSATAAAGYPLFWPMYWT